MCHCTHIKSGSVLRISGDTKMSMITFSWTGMGLFIDKLNM